MAKTILIGLDGASLDYILKWVNDGELPVFKEILSSGFYNELESIIPPWTGPAWPSLTTGKNPGKTGIFDFFKFTDHGYQRSLISSKDNRAKQIWDYLSEHGIKSIVINVPITHPPRKINGILIPGYLAPESPSCYPPGILNEYEEVYGKYKVYSDHEIDKAPPGKKLEGCINLTKLNKNALLYFSSKYEWDFLMVEFQKTDTVFHEFDDEKKILELYKEVDTSIGEFLRIIRHDANVLFASDHGMGKHKWVFYPNTWLKKKGLLKSGGTECEKPPLGIINLKLDGSDSGDSGYAEELIGFMHKLGLNAEIFDRGHWIIKKAGLSFLLKFIPETMTNAILRQEKAIDHASTRAFYWTSSSLGIRINLKGREPAGIVDNEEYHELRNYLIRELKNLRDPHGEKVFDKVLSREECYSGNYIENAPDVMLLPRNMDYALSDTVRSKTFIERERFIHKMNGLFMAYGPDIKRREKTDKFSLLDVAPTILHMSGLKIPNDMDGRVLMEIFREDSDLRKNGVKYRGGEEKERLRERVSILKSHSKI